MLPLEAKQVSALAIVLAATPPPHHSMRLWRMEGDKMGGPFVSHALLDKKKGRVIVAESFVYAPESKKANLIRRMEAALFTLRFVD